MGFVGVSGWVFGVPAADAGCTSRDGAGGFAVDVDVGRCSGVVWPGRVFGALTTALDRCPRLPLVGESTGAEADFGSVCCCEGGVASGAPRAVPEVPAMAVPIPRATASAPTRPMCIVTSICQTSWCSVCLPRDSANFCGNDDDEIFEVRNAFADFRPRDVSAGQEWKFAKSDPFRVNSRKNCRTIPNETFGICLLTGQFRVELFCRCRRAAERLVAVHPPVGVSNRLLCSRWPSPAPPRRRYVGGYQDGGYATARLRSRDRLNRYIQWRVGRPSWKAV